MTTPKGNKKPINLCHTFPGTMISLKPALPEAAARALAAARGVKLPRPRPE